MLFEKLFCVDQIKGPISIAVWDYIGPCYFILSQFIKKPDYVLIID